MDGNDATELGDSLFAEAIAQVRRHRGRPVLAGLCGSQGSGKSTMARRLLRRLGDMGLSAIVCGLDEFYLSRAARTRLAETVHPLLITRGVPGTHDIPLLHATLTALLDAREADRVTLPVFDKAADDRLPPERFPIHRGPFDVVLLEGWCIGARPQPADAIAQPGNALERDEDRDGIWRRFVNDQLAGPYAELFARLDLRLMLRAPGFGIVHRWRAEQEAGLARDSDSALPPMDNAALARFIAHYERLTRWLLDDQPAELIADLDADRVPLGWRTGRPARNA